MKPVDFPKTGTLPGIGHYAVQTNPSSESVSVGIWFPVGSRNETEKTQGISHFIEHLLFKGTQRRTPKQINEDVEGIGGYLNAFTSEEMTCYHASARASHLKQLLDVLLDMSFHSTFIPNEIERERGVIIEEIHMYDDQPAQVAQDAVNALYWNNDPLGRMITGTEASVKSIRRSDLLHHYKQHYHSGQCYITIAGKPTCDEVINTLKSLKIKIPKGPLSSPQPIARRLHQKPQVSIIQRDVEQTQLAMIFDGVSRAHRLAAAAKVYSVLMGENMSSRLFQQLREKRGLAYSIQSSSNYFRDCGTFCVSAGVEPKNTEKTIQLTLQEINRIATTPPKQAEVRRAKEYAIGQLCLAMESSSQQIQWIGEAWLTQSRLTSPSQWCQAIESVTIADVTEIARTVVKSPGKSLAIVTPENIQSKLKVWK